MNSVAFNIDPESVSQYEFSWSYCRNQGISKIIKKAHDKIKAQLKKNYKVRVWTADYPKIYYDKSPAEKDLIELETVSPTFENDNIFPDFAFGNWWDMGMEDFDLFTKEIRERNNTENIEVNKLFWIGNSMTSHNRNTYLGLCSKHNDILDGVAMNNWEKVDGGSRTKPQYFVPIKDHCRYKYLIDIAGHGYGSRIKFLPFCNRPMFVNQRYYFTWSCVEVLKHDLHIPIKEDLSDLVSQINWAESNQKLVFSNAKKLLDTCIDSLSFEKICDHAANLILSKI